MKIELNNFKPQFPHLSEETLKSFLRFLPVIWPGKHVLLCAHANKDNYSGDQGVPLGKFLFKILYMYSHTWIFFLLFYFLHLSFSPPPPGLCAKERKCRKEKLFWARPVGAYTLDSGVPPNKSYSPRVRRREFKTTSTAV